MERQRKTLLVVGNNDADRLAYLRLLKVDGWKGSPAAATTAKEWRALAPWVGPWGGLPPVPTAPGTTCATSKSLGHKDCHPFVTLSTSAAAARSRSERERGKRT